MRDAAALPTSLRFASLPNLRDLGGLPVTGGRLRPGLYRSEQLADLGAADRAAFSALGVRRVFDLRTAQERDALPDPLPEGASGVIADVLGESQDAAPAQLAALLAGQGGAADEARIAGLFVEAYRQFVTLPSARAAYGAVFVALAGEEGPALFHCTAGKDRTGWAAAALLTWCGAARETVLADYLASNGPILDKYAGTIDRGVARGLPREALVAAFGVRESYIEAAFAAMREAYGDVEGYFERGLGLGPDDQARLRARLIEPT